MLIIQAEFTLRNLVFVINYVLIVFDNLSLQIILND